jgi:hypothetical protein
MGKGARTGRRRIWVGEKGTWNDLRKKTLAYMGKGACSGWRAHTGGGLRMGGCTRVGRGTYGWACTSKGDALG